jgi:hypothetical protein
LTPLVIIFAPFVRLIFHSLAASLGFSGIALIAILPVQVIRWMSIYTTIHPEQVAVFELVESWILYIDAILLVFVILIYSLFFVFEQVRALWKLLKLQSDGPSPNHDQETADGAALQ